ncbi:probable serine/threonine-protein kinase drkB [Dysidea avara]|uniref:probable serine/threonine-protein kinase drkB n=1 Tax=Dysidea avara TaxID=196820 RepID=UPI00332FB1B2
MASFLAAAENLRHLKIPSSRVRPIGVELGRGSYGKVFEVKYDGKSCASKEVHRWMMELPTAEEQSKIKDDFLRECHFWSTLRHPNVVQFLGIYYPSRLRYLHGHNPPIVHRDLSPNNILVTLHLEAKITDLGVAKTMTMGPNSKTMTKTPGTVAFMPPEALDDKPVYGPPLDMFSFGDKETDNVVTER